MCAYFWIFWYWYNFQIKKYLSQKIFGKPIQKQRLNFRVNSRNLQTKIPVLVGMQFS